MAQTRSSRMAIVLNLAQKEEENAAQSLNIARQQLLIEQEQLQQLDDYRNQYLADYSVSSAPRNAQQLINYSSFIQRIDQLKLEQSQKVERAERVVVKAQTVWQQLYQKRKSIADLIERYKVEEQLAIDKKLQKEIDDLTTQRFSRQKDDG
ncbi:MAG: flagellar export protein FliJ [Cellvibrio sp.]